jgi:hypothetical protein
MAAIRQDGEARLDGCDPCLTGATPKIADLRKFVEISAKKFVVLNSP